MLADIRRDRDAAAAAPARDGDVDEIALVLSIVSLLAASGAVALAVTRPRSRALGA